MFKTNDFSNVIQHLMPFARLNAMNRRVLSFTDLARIHYAATEIQEVVRLNLQAFLAI